MHGVEFPFCGEQLVALPEKALWWPKEGTLFVADLHLGKGATMRAAGMPIPPGTTGATLAKLIRLIERLAPTNQQLRVERLVVLGDLIDSPAARAAYDSDVFLAVGAEKLLVRGNHDTQAGDPPAHWGFRCMEEGICLGPFVLRHYPAEESQRNGIAAHIHPCVRLKGRGRQTLRLPAFHLWRGGLVLPAFGEFTGGAEIPVRAGETAFVCAGDRVVVFDGDSR